MKEHILAGTAKGHTVTVHVNEQRGITLAEITSLELSDHDVLTLIAFFVFSPIGFAESASLCFPFCPAKLCFPHVGRKNTFYFL